MMLAVPFGPRCLASESGIVLRRDGRYKTSKAHVFLPARGWGMPPNMGCTPGGWGCRGVEWSWAVILFIVLGLLTLRT